MIGNDVIDLSLVEHYEGDWYKRMASKILSPFEYDTVSSQSFKSTTIWNYWAVKEAAFKAFKQCDSEIRFQPKEFIYFPVDHHVVYQGRKMSTLVESAPNYVHALVSRHLHDCVYRVSSHEGLSLEREAQSDGVRKLAIKVASNHGFGGIACWNKNERIPLLRIGERSIPLSLSHDGRFLAAALNLR